MRGLATNVANYNAFSIDSCPSYTQGSTVCDEKTYINNFAPQLKSAGFDAHFIVDTGMSLIFISRIVNILLTNPQAAMETNPPAKANGATGVT